MIGTLIIVRHGESLWNAKHTWTGLTDIGLSQKGKEEALKAAMLLQDKTITHAFTSCLRRAQETLQIILSHLHRDPPIVQSVALNERDYGEFTGKNKEEVRKMLGEEAYMLLRRGWDYPIKGGESLKQVYERVVPFYVSNIEPLLKNGSCVLIAAHGNSLRSLIKYLEHVSDENIQHVELKTGEIRIYSLDETGVLRSLSSLGNTAKST